jgi:arginine/lysine/ornithine decarboxylase
MRRFFKDEKTLDTCRIFRMLEENKGKHISFHTPGHKCTEYDLTELSFSDNLASPVGCIAQAQKDIAQILGAAASFILTDGSTSGVYAMLHAARCLGVKKIAAPALSHQSFFNGCELLGLTPILIKQAFADGIPLPLRLEDILPALDGADALFFTSPDYFGNIPLLAELHLACIERGKLTLIDGAHGGHLHFEKDLYAGAHADFWVDGVHKSLPALTQGAVVSAKYENYGEILENSVRYFRTTSPSYPIMASVEYAVKYPRNEWLEREAVALVSSMKNAYFGGDWTKLCVRVLEAEEESARLEKLGIYPEFAANHTICFYLSPATTEEEFTTVKEQLLYLDKHTVIPDECTPPPEVYGEVIGDTEEIELEKAEGRICARACGFFPPCLPFIQKGERVKRSQIERLTKAKSTFGLKDRKILVVKE